MSAICVDCEQGKHGGKHPNSTCGKFCECKCEESNPKRDSMKRSGLLKEKK